MKLSTILFYLVLNGCAASPPTLTEYQNRCANYGHSPGTPEMADCVARLDAAFWQERQAYREAIMGMHK